MTPCQQGNDGCPIRPEKGYITSLILYPGRATPALVLRSRREPYGRRAGAGLLQGQENIGTVCLEPRCLRGIHVSFIKGHLFLHTQNLARSTAGTIALTEYAKRKIQTRFPTPTAVDAKRQR